MSEFDSYAVAKAGFRSAISTISALAPWIQLWNEHESEELKRRVDRFWSAFVIEMQLKEKALAELRADVDYIQQSLGLAHRALVPPTWFELNIIINNP